MISRRVPSRCARCARSSSIAPPGNCRTADYDGLKAKYTEEALAALRAEEAHVATSTRPSSPSPVPSVRLTVPSRSPTPSFCSDCGRRLGTAPGYCSAAGRRSSARLGTATGAARASRRRPRKFVPSDLDFPAWISYQCAPVPHEETLVKSLALRLLVAFLALAVVTTAADAQRRGGRSARRDGRGRHRQVPRSAGTGVQLRC